MPFITTSLVNAKHVMMIEIFRQLKNQAMLFALRVKDGRTIFCVQTTQCAVPCKGKQTGLRKNTSSV